MNKCQVPVRTNKCFMNPEGGRNRLSIFPAASVVMNLPEMQESQETQVQFLSQEDSLEKGMALYSKILAQEMPWTEKPGGLQSMGSQKVGHDLVTKQ